MIGLAASRSHLDGAILLQPCVGLRPCSMSCRTHDPQPSFLLPKITEINCIYSLENKFYQSMARGMHIYVALFFDL